MAKRAGSADVGFRAGVPGWSAEVGTRLQALFDAAGGISRASRISDVSLETLGHWRDGKSRPAFFPLAALCEATGVSMQWLATGRGPMRDGDADHTVRAATPVKPGLLFGTVDTGRLDEAFKEALARSGIPASEIGDTSALMLLTILLHDAATKASHATKSEGSSASRAKVPG
ncbi:helix-turn-helix transcriptional regulator [Roseomonas terrae]|uniref:Helix-turn-helix transcriptional regulator n=1 Tax=Neoroseomonas terrae TaxID=424799 RepID=A0ABS5EH53_9PROT|nr:helix-turn-helix transcriptional regulator [Neoroseomonas terrae]MBR0650359.1 helix-turn-helix transcriptional regulator [Neoroseomonas terrae]